MTVIKRYDLRCDECSRTIVTGASYAAKARQVSTREGWSWSRDANGKEHDYCPEHVELGDSRAPPHTQSLGDPDEVVGGDVASDHLVDSMRYAFMASKEEKYPDHAFADDIDSIERWRDDSNDFPESYKGVVKVLFAVARTYGDIGEVESIIAFLERTLRDSEAMRKKGERHTHTLHTLREVPHSEALGEIDEDLGQLRAEGEGNMLAEGDPPEGLGVVVSEPVMGVYIIRLRGFRREAHGEFVVARVAGTYLDDEEKEKVRKELEAYQSGEKEFVDLPDHSQSLEFGVDHFHGDEHAVKAMEGGAEPGEVVTDEEDQPIGVVVDKFQTGDRRECTNCGQPIVFVERRIDGWGGVWIHEHSWVRECDIDLYAEPKVVVGGAPPEEGD